MLTLARAMAKGGSTGDPLPTVFSPLERAGVRPRRGQVTMVVGIPNSGKSAFAQWYASELARRHSLSGLYFSADTDVGTIVRRQLAMLTGQDQRVIEHEMTGPGAGYYEDLLTQVSGIRWVFEASPTLDDIDLEMAAFEELHGVYPDVVYVDNILNVAFDNGDEWSSIRELSKVLHHLARETGCAFFALHHATEATGRPEYPPARKDIQGKIAQMPELILSIARSGGEFRVACTKNRSGPADPTGREYTTLYADLDRMQFLSSRYEAQSAGVA